MINIINGLKIRQPNYINISTLAEKKIFDFFILNNFLFLQSNELDNVENCFDFLLMDDDHPARSIKDTFYINKKKVLRTHTTNFQQDAIGKFFDLNNSFNSVGFFTFGKVYRKDKDNTHLPIFNQIDFILFDLNNSINKLFFIIKSFLQFFFGIDIQYRYRISFFPFTVPSFEIDIKCFLCSDICNFCNTGWIEIAGCGMTHPNVISNHKKFRKNNFLACAAGIGIERLIMLKYKIKNIQDIKQLYIMKNKKIQ